MIVPRIPKMESTLSREVSRGSLEPSFESLVDINHKTLSEVEEESKEGSRGVLSASDDQGLSQEAKPQESSRQQEAKLQESSSQQEAKPQESSSQQEVKLTKEPSGPSLSTLATLQKLWGLDPTSDDLRPLIPKGFLAPMKQQSKLTEGIREPKNYTKEHNDAATIIQAWWKGWLVRSRLTICAVAARLDSGRKLGQREQSKRRCCSHMSAAKRRNLYGVNAKYHSELAPWPRFLVKELIDFLNTLETPIVESKPQRRRTPDTLTGIYNSWYATNNMSDAPPFTYSVEKRALRQLAESRRARAELASKQEDIWSYEGCIGI